MSHFEATKILNRIKDGADYTLATINQALFLTGDIDEHKFNRVDGSDRSARVGFQIQPKSCIARASRSSQLVARNNQ